MGDSIDDAADEVKVFRKTDADDAADIQASAQLHEDKQDVAFEAEMESHHSINGLKPTLNFPFNMPLTPMSWMTSPYQSPAYAAAAAAAIMTSPHYQMAVMRMQQLASLNSHQQHHQQQQQHLHFNQQNHHFMGPDQKPTTSSAGQNCGGGPMMTPKRKKENRESKVKDKDHIKKPLNAFMWFMKENRQKVLLEEGNASKQSAELNTILGKMWHDLDKEAQQKYYEKAKMERENHAKKYPNWTARENYAIRTKKRKKRERSIENLDSKKCRARFGLANHDAWCKHCKRKKRCLLVRDSESPHNAGSSSTNPTTPHMMASPASCFGPISRSSTASNSEEEDIKDIKPIIHKSPLMAGVHAQAQAQGPNPMMSMPNMMQFAAQMSPSFQMFNFNLNNMGGFGSPSFPMMPATSFPTVTRSPQIAATLQTLN